MATPIEWLAIGSAVVGAATSTYSIVEQKKQEKAAAEFNADEQRKASKVVADDFQANSLRLQEQKRKRLASIRARTAESGQLLEGGRLDFLNESAGNLDLRIKDAAVANQRQQAGYLNNAFAYDAQAEYAKKTTATAGFTTALNGVTSTARTAFDQGLFTKTDQN